MKHFSSLDIFFLDKIYAEFWNTHTASWDLSYFYLTLTGIAAGSHILSHSISNDTPLREHVLGFIQFYTGAWAGIEPGTSGWEDSDNTTEPLITLNQTCTLYNVFEGV